MCDFFSFCSNGRGSIKYIDWPTRQKVLSGEIKMESPDSHTSILDYFGIEGKQQDKWNKYEYNPLTKEFKIDRINNKDDSKQMESWFKGLDFKTIVEPLIIKPIANPMEMGRKNVTKKAVELLDERTSVRTSVRASVWDSVGDSVWASVWASVRDSVGALVRDSVWDSVGGLVWGLVWDSVWDSVWGYASSFFDIYPDGNPYQSCIDLWEMGFVPSFDGKTWWLHGYEGKIVFEKVIG